MSDTERVSESDRMLVIRMEAELQAAAKLQQFVTNHLTLTYKLKPGDGIQDDSSITRRTTDDAEPLPFPSAAEG